jgi:polyketide biosynthesis acyl carrier protein
MDKDQIVGIIVRHAREVIPELAKHRFAPSDSLRELGANSIDRPEIVMMTLDSCALVIPMIETARAGSIGELAEILHEKLSAL